MKTNELNNGIKERYTKPALDVESIEVQWDFLGGTTFSGLTDYTFDPDVDWADTVEDLIENFHIDPATIPTDNQCAP